MNASKTVSNVTDRDRFAHRPSEDINHPLRCRWRQPPFHAELVGPKTGPPVTPGKLNADGARHVVRKRKDCFGQWQNLLSAHYFVC